MTRVVEFHTPNANMADHSVVARDELHESEFSESSMICFENASLRAGSHLGAHARAAKSEFKT